MRYIVTATATKTAETSCTIDDAMEVLFGKLDEAIDDMENGRVQIIEEAWKRYIIQNFKYCKYAENFSF